MGCRDHVASIFGPSIRAWRIGVIAPLLIALLLGPASASQPSSCEAGGTAPWLDFGPAVVSLKGFVVRKEYYGPPNHGDTPEQDEKFWAWILLLAKPINIRASPDPEDHDFDAVGVRQVQLHVPAKVDNAKGMSKKLRQYLGREIYVTGELYEPRTGWYWTPYALQVDSISLVPRSTSRKE